MTVSRQAKRLIASSRRLSRNGRARVLAREEWSGPNGRVVSSLISVRVDWTVIVTAWSRKTTYRQPGAAPESTVDTFESDVSIDSMMADVVSVARMSATLVELHKRAVRELEIQ